MEPIYLGHHGQLPPMPDKEGYNPPKFNGCKHLRSLYVRLPAGHRAKRKAKRKAQRQARKG